MLAGRNPRGFTLVEMLVAVALVLLMMSMFAEIFQIAGGSIAKTRGIAENDQRSRTLQTIIKADLDKRTFRWVYPFAAGEQAGVPESNIGNRQGYFYISGNSPYNGLDNVLQFTVASSNTMINKDDSPYYGKARNLASFTFPNQPDADDAQLSPNNTGASTAAEVVYFVRNGNLYRRQLLIRKPLSVAGSNPQPDDSIPVTNPTGKNVFDPTVSPAPAFQYGTAEPFWNDFDYSAYYNEQPAGTVKGAQFLGTDSLSNAATISVGAIAAPFRRFGHHHFGFGVTVGHAGRPKEFTHNNPSTTPRADFIGRFTLQECSDPDFRYPNNRTAGNNVPTNPTLTLSLDPNDKTITSPEDFSQGTRRGEDLLLSNVHAFEILVWDDNYGGFVNLGDPSLPSTSDYYISWNPTNSTIPLNASQNKRRNNSYGPRTTETPAEYEINAVFDTWHPFIDIDGAPGNDEPPFRPITYRPDYISGAEPTPTNSGGQSAWQQATVYALGDIVFPTSAVNPVGSPFYYRCVKRDRTPKNKGKGKGIGLQGNNTSDDTDEPIWPRAAGLTVEDNALTWQAVDNRKPLKAIKLEIRFMDTSTQQMRQLTIVHSLVD